MPLVDDLDGGQAEQTIAFAEMGTSRATERAVDLNRLWLRWGAVETRAVSPALDWQAGLPRKRMAAAAILVDDDDRVLLVRPTYRPGWDLPGGVVEADEAPRLTLRRELAEELGLDRPVGRLLAVDWVPPAPARTEGLIIVFDGGRLAPDDAAAIRLPAEELSAWSFTPADAVPDLMAPLLARRVAACLAARATGVTVYLEDGTRHG